MGLETAIGRIRARRAALAPESDGSSSADVSVRGEEGSLEDRRMSQEEWDARSEELRERGLEVTLRFSDPPEEPEWYQPRLEAEWVSDEHHEAGGYWHEREAPLLFVGLVPRKGAPRLSNRPRRRSELYAIPLCRTTELHRFDLRDPARGVRLGLEAYRRLRARYDGRAAVLRGR
ncbi:MAG: hypothetical protein B7Z80_26025, partial [Rhodospirillales bacterium 20-64-7]